MIRKFRIALSAALICIIPLTLNAQITFKSEKSDHNVVRKFFTSSFQPEKALKTSKIRINFKDSIPDDTLTIYFSNNNLPDAISRNIHTAVCMDTLCRLVDITLYWAITGKYLGYTLPDGKELTKKEHIPFSSADYSRLNEILGDSASQLRNFTPEDMHPAKKPVKQTDGITGATLPDVASWIVPEAAYTSYALWHLTYGANRDSAMAHIKKRLLSDHLLLYLLQNSDPYGQVRGFQWIGSGNVNSRQFIEPALKILHSQNYKSVGYAIKFLKSVGIDEGRLQKEVVSLLDSEDFRIKYVAIDYLREFDNLTQPVARDMMSRLNGDNYYLVNVILTLLERRFHPDGEDQRNLSKLLNSKNTNVAIRVYKYLLGLHDQSPDLVKQLNRYRRRAL